MFVIPLEIDGTPIDGAIELPEFGHSWLFHCHRGLSYMTNGVVAIRAPWASTTDQQITRKDRRDENIRNFVDLVDAQLDWWQKDFAVPQFGRDRLFVSFPSENGESSDVDALYVSWLMHTFGYDMIFSKLKTSSRGECVAFRWVSNKTAAVVACLANAG